jgi:thiosulfate reductase cytochrome b subunit
MKPPLTALSHEVVDEHDQVHEWRVWQLTRLGVPWSVAQVVADHVDWHQVARLVQRGCPPRLALDIVR